MLQLQSSKATFFKVIVQAERSTLSGLTGNQVNILSSSDWCSGFPLIGIKKRKSLFAGGIMCVSILIDRLSYVLIIHLLMSLSITHLILIIRMPE